MTAVALVDALVERGTVPGAALVVVSSAGVVVEHYAGAADRDGAVAVGPETRFALASLTKPLVALAALVAVEEGILDLDAPIAEVVTGVPAWITLRNSLAHYSGLPEGATVGELGVAIDADWPILRAAYARVSPIAGPGERRIYSNPAYAIVGAAIEEAAGIAIADYLHGAVLAPLRMAHTSLGLAPDAPAAWVRDAGLWARGVPLFNSAWFRAQPFPQSAGWSTGRDYAAFLAAILRRADGLVSPETLAEMLTNQGGCLAGGVESFMTWPQADWALGFELRGTKEQHWTGAALAPTAATHFGASGTLCFVDPAADLGAVLLCNRGTYSGWMLAAGGWPEIVSRIVRGD